MENPIDHTIDLGFVNYVQHPDNRHYIVFRFPDTNRAGNFEECLAEEKIWFEKDKEFKRTKEYTLFAIHHTDFKKAEKINFKVEGMHKKPIIPFKGLRYSLLIFSAFALTLALIGYCEAQKKINQSANTSNQ